MIFSSNFFPCVDFFRFALREEVIFINTIEQYKKQSYRTRAYILGPHQVETIHVPVKKYSNNELIKNIKIDYSENWNTKAWKTIQNSYKNSPYFEYYEDYVSKVFAKKYENLLELNYDTMTICLKLLKINKTICQEYFSYYDNKERFVSFNAKNRLENSDKLPFEAYLQNFGKKFEPNLSILDMLFMNGTSSVDLLSIENQMVNI